MPNRFPRLALILLACSGCTLAPRYQRPAQPVPEVWPGGPSSAGRNGPSGATSASAPPAADLGWREFFTDPRLQRLVQLALENNRDLRIAALNVELTRQQFRIERAAWLPAVVAAGGLTRQRTPAVLSASGQASTRTQYNVGLAVTSYELDFFGRVRSLANAALEQYFSTVEAQRSAHLALVAEVAIQYLQLRELDEQLAVANQTLRARQSSLGLTQETFNAGAASELDVRSAEAQFQSARADVAAFTRQRAQAENGLALLVGTRFPPDLPEGRTLGDQNLISDLPAGLPSELLQRRPDILSAEHALKAANANIGAARAAFFPSISLTGQVGRASIQLSDLYNSHYNSWSFSPQINLPIFSGGRNLAALRVSEVAKRIQVADYEATIQTAFREVSDALAARALLDEQIDALGARVAAEQRRTELAEVRYRSGVENFLAVLTAQQDLYVAQQSLIQSRFARLQNLVTLYQVLGGGWIESSATADGLTTPANRQ